VRLYRLKRVAEQEELRRVERRELYLRFLNAVSQLRQAVFALRRAIGDESWHEGQAEEAPGTRGATFRTTFAALHDYWEVSEEIRLVASQHVHDALQGQLPRWPRHPEDLQLQVGRRQLLDFAEQLSHAGRRIQEAMRYDLGYADAHELDEVTPTPALASEAAPERLERAITTSP